MNKMSSNFWLLAAVIAAALPLTGCLSEEEKEARRAWAYDLEGSYDEEREQAAPGQVEVINEQDKNDVRVVFTRGDLYEGEQAWLDLIADEEERAEVAAELVLGEGFNQVEFDLVGGENISDNFGESSTVAVSGARLDATPKLDEATDAKLYYSLKATIVNGSDELKGTLTVHYQDRRPDPEGDEEDNDTRLHKESERYDIVLIRQDGAIEADVCQDCTTGPQGDGEPEADAEQEAEAEA